MTKEGIVNPNKNTQISTIAFPLFYISPKHPIILNYLFNPKN